MKLIKYPKRKDWRQLLQRPIISTESLDSIIKEVFDDIQISGDEALKKYTKKFDKVSIDQLKISPSEIEAAENLMTDELKKAIQLAKNNIESFHRSQQIETNVIITSPGVECWQYIISQDEPNHFYPEAYIKQFLYILQF